MSSATTSKATPGDSPWALPQPGPASPSAPKGPGAAKRPQLWRGGAGPPGGGVTISHAGDNQPGQGEQALNPEGSPRDRPLKPGDVGHGARKYHGGALRGHFGVRRQSPPGEGRGQRRGSARWSSPSGAVVALRAASAGGSCRAGQGGDGGAALRFPHTAAPPARGSDRDATAEAAGDGNGTGVENENGAAPACSGRLGLPVGTRPSPCPVPSPALRRGEQRLRGARYLSPLPCPSAGSAI